jgi:hypothetical protein
VQPELNHAPFSVDSCVVLSLFIGDSEYGAAEQWLFHQGDQPFCVSHWVSLAFAGAVALAVQATESVNLASQLIQQERWCALKYTHCVFLIMRTTLELPDPLFARLKAKAAIERVTLKQLLRHYVEQGLESVTSAPSVQRLAGLGF